MAYSIRLKSAQCAVDLGDGSERGEYVSQDYILNVLGRPHRAVNIMYTYYPNDSQWPMRISEACADMKVEFAWDYPYDDYYPFVDGGKQFEQMRDIRRHGQDVMLTLTVDCAVSDGQIYDIAKKLSCFGRMFLRINHECNGNWFTHNRRYSYSQISDFFVRFSRIIKEAAPNVSMVFCAGLAGDVPDENGEYVVDREDVFADAYRIADVWSADKYLALHYGWPYDVCERGGGRYTGDDPDVIYTRYKRTYERLSKLYGPHPFIQAELNADGDVTGPLGQGRIVRRYYDKVRNDRALWLTGISMYQFRDRGRLGLEIEDPNDPGVGIRQPLMDEYRKIIRDDYYMPVIETGDDITFPARLRWGGSEDADGIGITVSLTGMPEFCEAEFDEQLSLMIEFGGRWFYKSKGVKVIDLMPAFFEHPVSGACDIPLRIFATPPDGVNEDDGTDGWATDQYYTMEEEPGLRIRYEVPYEIR